MSMLRQQSCLRCGYTWWPRTPNRSVRCPECRSPYWHRPRRQETGSPTTINGGDGARLAPSPPSSATPEQGARKEDQSLVAALTFLRELKGSGRSWGEMGDELLRRFGMKLDKDQLKALIR